MPTLSLNSAGTVQLALGSNVRGVCRLWGIEQPKIHSFPVNFYLGLPLPGEAANTQKTGLVVCPSDALVLGVLASSDGTQIHNSVVGPISVDVVNVTGRECSVSVEPCKPVSAIGFAVNLYYAIPVRVLNSSLFKNTSQKSLQKNPSLWVVVKQFAQARCGKIGLSHDTVPSLIGQRPACVDSTGGPRHFTTQACSGAPGNTKHFYKAKASLAGFFTPFFLNPLGALTPFNAL